MKITKYPHRYTISMNEAEWFAFRALVSNGKATFEDEDHLRGLTFRTRSVIESARWQLVEGPLTVDEVKTGRGGYAKGD